MKRITLVLLLCLACLSCQKKGIEEVEHGNFKVAKLFTHDGITMYRFYDTHYVYFGVRENGTVLTDFSSGGKNSRQIQAEVSDGTTTMEQLRDRIRMLEKDVERLKK